MHAVQKRDHQAFTELLARHIHGLHAYTFRFTRNASDAEEITQEVFLRVWKQAKTWQPGRVNFSTWLYRITYNLCVDAYRKNQSAAEKTLTETEEILLSTEPGQEETLDKNKQQFALRTAVHALPARQRDAILLCNLQGFSNRQAAEILQISIEALESLLARARLSLKKSLGDHKNPSPISGNHKVQSNGVAS